jgi:3-oxoadipate enol-lactonase
MSWIDLGDVGLEYELTGTGPSVVLLHELGGSLESFEDVVPALARDFRVLRFDQRGAGKSEKLRTPITLADLVGDLDGLAAAVGLAPPFHLAGIAAGAGLAVGYALAHPDRVAALGLCAPALTTTPEQRHYLVERSARAVGQGMRAIVETSLGRSYPERFRQDGTYAAYRARFLGNDPVCYANANLALPEYGLDGQFGRLDVPCLVLAGEHDGLRPPEAGAAVADQIAGARFEVIDSGHLMAVQAPVELARRLGDFFQQHSPRSAARP